MLQPSVNNINQRLLALFNIVLEDSSESSKAIYNMEQGFVLCGSFSDTLNSDVERFITNNTVSDSELTKTFYKSWTDVTDKTRMELFVDQVAHYMTTYGELTPGFMYIPNDEFTVQLPTSEKVPVRVIKTVTKDEAIGRITEYLDSGIALEQSTMTDLVSVLYGLDYEFNDSFRNKEANILVTELTGKMPAAAEEFLRYVLFKVTDSTLLIKNPATIEALKASDFDYYNALRTYIKQHGIVNLAKVFNRFKPLFLAMKRATTKRTINSISKLSKKVHEPMVQTALNFVTSKEIEAGDMHWLTNATTFALLRALNVIALAEHNPTDFTYRIRNGKLFTKTRDVTYDAKVLKSNRVKVLDELKSRVDGAGKTVYIPEGIDYGLPTSEKSFVGNIPTMTKFTGDTLNVGMFWKNSYGASDLDLSSISIDGTKVGWNDHYNTGNVTYSGDITNAPKGAAEYLRFGQGCGSHVVFLNVYCGDEASGYDLIVGSTDEQVDSKQVMKPENLIAQARKTTRNRQSILGFVNSTDDNVEFIATEFDAGVHTVSGGNDMSAITLKSLLFKNEHSLRLAATLSLLGYDVVNTKEEDVDIDLSIGNLSKDSIISLFK